MLPLPILVNKFQTSWINFDIPLPCLEVCACAVQGVVPPPPTPLPPQKRKIHELVTHLPSLGIPQPKVYFISFDVFPPLPSEWFTLLKFHVILYLYEKFVAFLLHFVLLEKKNGSIVLAFCFGFAGKCKCNLCVTYIECVVGKKFCSFPCVDPKIVRYDLFTYELLSVPIFH